VGSSAEDDVKEKSRYQSSKVFIYASKGWSKVEGLLQAHFDDGLGVLVESFSVDVDCRTRNSIGKEKRSRS
jgi:hypothetical protein